MGYVAIVFCATKVEKFTVEGFDGSLEELAEKLGDLRYDTLVEFLGHFSQKIRMDGAKDQAGERYQLASSLFQAADEIEVVKESINKAWDISEPFMK